VELVRRYYAPDWKWVARIYDTYGNGYDLAIIHSGSNRIYKALCVTEEAYPDPADPFWTAKFYHYHPQYKSGGTWYDWPASSGTNVNKITTTEGTCPAHYGALPYLGGDPRYWYAGTAGSNQYWCQVNPLFPASTTYLPDIKANYGGWNSFIAIRNNGSQTAAVQVAFYDSNGNHVADKVKENLSARGTWILPATDAGLNNWRGSAVVYASEDVGVVVNNHGPNNTNYSYSAAGPQGTTLYLPSTHRNDWGWYSDIAVQNVGTTAANVRLTFRNAGGTYKHQVTANNVPPGATRFFPTASYGQLGSYYGPAVLESTNGVPLTAVVREWNTASGGPDLAYHGLASAANRLYLPSQHKDSWGWTSWVHMQNPNSSSATMRMRYYQTNGALKYTTPTKTIPAHGSKYFWTGDYASQLGSNYFGPAELERTSGGNVVAICNEVNTGKALSYSGFPTTGSSSLCLPAQGYVGDWNTWTFIQNPNGASANATVTYRDTNGTWRGSSTPTIPGHGSACLVASDFFSYGTQGSAWVSANRPVVTIVNQVGSAGDQTMSYNGLLR